MRHIRIIVLFLGLSQLCGISHATDTDLQVTVLAVSGRNVSITVHNPGTSSEIARVQTTVRFADDSTQTITSCDFSINGGAAVPITLVAVESVVAIDDDPVPINP